LSLPELFPVPVVEKRHFGLPLVVGVVDWVSQAAVTEQVLLTGCLFSIPTITLHQRRCMRIIAATDSSTEANELVYAYKIQAQAIVPYIGRFSSATKFTSPGVGVIWIDRFSSVRKLANVTSLYAWAQIPGGRGGHVPPPTFLGRGTVLVLSPPTFVYKITTIYNSIRGVNPGGGPGGPGPPIFF